MCKDRIHNHVLGKLFVTWDVFSDFLQQEGAFVNDLYSFFVVATNVVLFIMSFLNDFGCLDNIFAKNCILLRILNEMLLTTRTRKGQTIPPPCFVFLL